jgi:hypothetical protein
MEKKPPVPAPGEIGDKLFQAFVPFGKSHGLDLGLSISKKIVEDHHGRTGTRRDFLLRAAAGEMKTDARSVLRAGLKMVASAILAEVEPGRPAWWKKRRP